MNEARKRVPFDPVQRPAHYNQHPSGVEVADISDGMNFDVGNAFKYVGRHTGKGSLEQDLGKALWYLRRELERRQKDPILAKEELEAAMAKWVEAEPDPQLAKIYDLIFCALDDETDTSVLVTAVAELELKLEGVRERGGG